MKLSILSATLAAILSLFGAHQAIAPAPHLSPPPFKAAYSEKTASLAAAALPISAAPNGIQPSQSALTSPQRVPPTTNALPLAVATPLSSSASAGPAAPQFSTSDFVTHAELNAQVQGLGNSLRQLIFSNFSAPASLPASGGFTNNIALSNRIDQLTNTTITNATVHGVNGLTAADIPTNVVAANYLPLFGGSVIGSLSLTDSSTSSVASLGTERTTDGSFTADPSSSWTLGSGWSWNSGDHRASYTGTGGPIAGNIVSGITDSVSVISIDDGGSGYTNGDTITISTGSADATYTATVSSGKVTGLTQVSAGTAYTAGAGKATTGGTGTGLVVSVAQVADGSTLTQTIPTSPSDPVVSYILPRFDGDVTWTGTPYRVAFTIQNYSGAGKVANAAFGSSGLQSNTTESNNTAVGFYALQTNTTGGFNTAVGNQALYLSTTATFNTAVGQASMWANTSGSNNAALGYASLFTNKTGNNNAALGYASLYANTTGSNNVGIGYLSLYSNTTGGNNTAVGNNSVLGNTTGSNNTANGYFSLYYATSTSNNTALGYFAMQGNTTGSLTISGTSDVALGREALSNYITSSNSVAVGYQAMKNATTSQNNTAVGYSAGLGTSNNDNYQGLSAFGYQAGFSLSNGSDYNTLVGYQSGFGITTGARNVLIGPTVTFANKNQVTTGSGNIAIGNDVAIASSTLSNQLEIGNFIYGTGLSGTGSTVSSAFIGIGTTSPTTALQVNGVITPNADNTSSLGNSSYHWSALYSTNNVIQTSDARLKENIATTTYGLDQVMKLRPVSFTWKAQPQQGTQLGFIAQEVQPILPETVNVGDDANHTLGLTYTEFIPVIVQAIQQIASVSGAFEQSLIAWLGNASNGIGDLFANNIYAANDVHVKNELCIGQTCVTETQLKAMLAAAGSTGASPGGGSNGSATSGASSTPDTTPPTITINGDNPAHVNIGDSYADLGASVTDNIDQNLGYKTFLNGALVSDITIDTSRAATDTIDYVATDTWGNTSTSTRTVIVEASPSIVPTNAASSAASTTP